MRIQLALIKTDSEDTCISVKKDNILSNFSVLESIVTFHKNVISINIEFTK